MISMKEFLGNVIMESLHPELKAIASAPQGRTSKKTLLVNKIKEITSKGEKTGIEGNMPKGSSRAYLPHAEHEDVEIDGAKAKMKIGTKVAIKASLDSTHDRKAHDGMSLGQLQNEAEGGDHFLNEHYRVLSKEGGRNDSRKYKDNTESGIFPPLVDHDHDTHEWSQVGHVDNVKPKEFKELTKTDTHPGGISHGDFTYVLRRKWDQNHGKYWKKDPRQEAELDHIESHPLVQKFLDHQGNFNAPPHDYNEIKNMGAWKHPVTGQKHIVARDHGFNETVMNAYKEARVKIRK